MSWKETDPLLLWKNSTIVPKAAEDTFVERDAVTRRFVGTRSKMWTSLSEMTPENRNKYLSKLVNTWPFKWEYRAVHLPSFFLAFSAAASGGYIGTKLCADTILFNPKAKFLDVFRKGSIIPTTFGMYSSATTVFALDRVFVHMPVLSTEEKPNAWSVTKKTIACSVFSGVVFPAFTLPYIVHHLAVKDAWKPSKNGPFDMILLSFDYSRSIRRALLPLIAAQTLIGSIAAYVFLWGRGRIFETVDVDPEFIRECVSRPDSEPSLVLKKITRFLYRIGNFGFEDNSKEP